ncbi:MAG: hypothetical protein SFU91_03210 [Chloroherpetonaceae bacterium]|nr:hypothetical protein [Chloroherpetonaceae bacterium]
MPLTKDLIILMLIASTTFFIIGFVVWQFFSFRRKTLQKNEMLRELFKDLSDNDYRLN